MYCLRVKQDSSDLTLVSLAILLCSPLIRQYLINYARPLIYTTFMSYPALAAIRASYTYLQCGKTEAVSIASLPPSSTVY
jgi:7-keto-8-aminopelargonate synthetase-like enzyme